MQSGVMGIVGLVLLSIGSAIGEPRTWTDTTGKFKLDAEFVSLEDGIVTLRRASGKTQKLPLEKLSEADREIASKLASAAKPGLDRTRPSENESNAVESDSVAFLEKAGGRFAGDFDIEDGIGEMGSLIYWKVSKQPLGKKSAAIIKELQGLDKLEGLDLYRTQITDAGLAHLEGLTKLETLDLSSTKVTDAGLAHLKGMTGLEALHLNGTEITDAGLAHLKKLTKLKALSLSGTATTDAGLMELKRMRNLVDLNLFDTKITDAGVEKLQAALPKCRVTRMSIGN